MLAFVQLEVICGIILIVAFGLTIPLHVLALHYRQFAPLRDVQPLLCMLTHGGYFMFTVHFFFAWYHERELCYELAIIQMFGNVLLYGCFVSKHYALHKRYRIVSTALPTHIVFALSAFPFLILCTYRVATREEDHCPNVEAVAAGCASLVLLITMTFFALKEHPSSHFVRAKYVECGAILFAIGASFLHQWEHADAAVVPLLFLCAIFANWSFLAYVLPPIRLALMNGSEFTDEHNRIANESITNSMLRGEGNGEVTCGDACVGRMASCVRVILGCNTDDSDPDLQGTFSSNPATPIAQRSDGNPIYGGVAQSPAQQRQEVEIQQELHELIEIIREGDSYRLQKIVNRRGVALINLGDGNGRTPLHHAVRVGELNCIRFLHAMGADTNKFDNHGRAPLHDAARTHFHHTGSSGQIHGDRCMIITELLRSGAVVNLPTSHGNTALHYAVLGNQLGAVNTLLRHDANPLFQHDREDSSLTWQEAHVTNCLAVGDSAFRKSPLMLAVEMGNVAIVSSMIHHIKSSKKVNFDLRCIHGMSMVHVALCLGNSGVVQVLLREGCCSPWAMHEESNMNVLHMAALGDSALSVAFLLNQMGAIDLIPAETEFTNMAPRPQGQNISLTAHSASKRSVGQRPLGSGVEHMLDAVNSSMPPSPSERASRANSFFGSRVQYGCAEPLFGATPQTMGFGEAIAILREHIPHASAEHSKIDDLEASVDRAVQNLKLKSNAREIEKLQCAMIVVVKRIRMSGVRSMSGMIMSTASMPGGSSTCISSMRGGQDVTVVMQRITDLLRSSDHIGMTPLHYAIQQKNANLAHIYASYGAVASSSEITDMKRQRTKRSGQTESDGNVSTSPRSSDDGAPFLVNATICGINGGRDSPPRREDDNCDTAAFIGSLTQNFGGNSGAQEGPDLDLISLKSYSRDVRRYVEDDEEAQEVLLSAIQEGMSTYSRFLNEDAAVA